MDKKIAFEKFWSDQHSVPFESMEQYRFATTDSYRLPDMAAAYRNFCAGFDLGRSFSSTTGGKP